MNRIAFPLKPQMKRAAVGDLHAALGLLGYTIPDAEQSIQRYGTATRDAVRKLQADHGLAVTGMVDEATAALLNRLLAERGALDEEITYTVKGVVRAADGAPASGLTVRAFDRDVSRETLLGEGVTGQDGSYQISFGEAQFKGSSAERGGPEVFVRVFDKDGQSLAQSKTISNAHQQIKIDLRIPADLFCVRGVVRFTDGKPASGLGVRIFDHNIGAEDALLGQDTTDKEGSYAIWYASNQLEGKGAADLAVRLYRDDNLIQETEIIFNASPIEIRDFILTAPPRPHMPEIQRLDKQIQSLLGGRLKIDDLSKDQVDFLHKKTGYQTGRIEWLVTSRRLAGDNESLAYLYYALQSEGLPTDPAEILKRDRNEIHHALHRAHTRKLIPDLPSEEIDRILNVEMPRLRAQNLLLPCQAGGPASLGDLLRTMPVPLLDDDSIIVADIVARVGVDYGQLAGELDRAGITCEQATRVERTLRLGDLTSNHAPLVRHLQELFDDGDDASLTSLARLSLFAWADKAYTYGVPAQSSLTPMAYARQLEQRIESLNPTAMLAARLKDKSLVLQPSEFEHVEAFLTNNPTFDITRTDIRGFVEQANLDGISDEKEKQALIYALLQTQRVKQLPVTWQETGRLLNAGVGSMLDLVQLGNERVRLTLAGIASSERADRIFDHAKALHDKSLALMVNLMPRYAATDTTVIPNSQRVIDTSVLKDYPTLQALFGAQDYCTCDHSESVLSPAAYLVDLLQFLNPQTDQRALKALLARRPDLVDLELSTENTEIEIPHIDLVLEILENAVALPLHIEIPGVDCEKSLSAQAPQKEIIDGLRQTSLAVGSDFHATKGQRKLEQDPAELWSITDGRRQWTLRCNNADGIHLFIPGVQKSVLLSVTHDEIPLLVVELDQGRLSATRAKSLNQMLSSSLRKSGIVGRLGVIEYRVTTATLGRRWDIRCQIGIEVRIFHSFISGRYTISLTTPEGDVIASEECSVQTASYISSVLQHGSLSDELLALMGLGVLGIPGSYTIRAIKSNLEETQSGIHNNESEAYLVWLNDDMTLQLTFEPSSVTINAITYQSYGSGEDLRAAPENLNPAAYTCLSKAHFPWNLPFNLPLEEVRAYLDRFGVSRRKLIDLSRPHKRLTDVDVIYEWLGLSQAEAKLIAPSTPHNEDAVYSHWGIDGLANDGKVSIYDAAAGEIVSGSRLEVLSRVSILMQQARISYDDLHQVLHTGFVAFQGSIQRTAVCSPSQETLIGLNIDNLDRMHRFVRLWRKLGWRVGELDLAMQSFGTHDLPRLLQFLAHIERLRDRLDLPIIVLLSWWSAVISVSPAFTRSSERDTPALYDQLFQNPLVQDPPDSDFMLNSSRDEVVRTASSMLSKVPAIAAALGTRQEDVSLLWTQLKPELHLSDRLHLRSLFEIYRVSRLAQALGISIEDYLRVRTMTGIKPFESTGLALDFCEQVSFIQDSGLSFEELAYLIQHETAPGSTIGVSDERLTQMLLDIRSALQIKLNTIEQAVRALIEANFLVDDARGLLEKQPFDESRLTLPEVRAQLTDAAIERVAYLYGLDDTLARWLLCTDVQGRAALEHPGDHTRDAIEVFLDSHFIGAETPLDRNNCLQAFQLMIRLHKAALLFIRLNVKREECRWLRKRADSKEGMVVLFLSDLPTTESDTVKLYPQWQRFATLFSIRNRRASMAQLLTAYVAALATSVNENVFDCLDTALALDSGTARSAGELLGIADGCADPLLLAQLLDLLSLTKRFGATVEQVQQMTDGLSTNDATSVTRAYAGATTARALLRAKYGAERWHDVVKPISDRLRARRRDALVDYLVAREELRGADMLYEYYLIDPQMEPICVTTRMLQAISSVQLFVQRCLLNLEKNVPPSAINRKRWEWMKSYRVWEAGRKVFLYPENWLHPELRDDKTQLFRQLESGLSQAEPSYQQAVQGVREYLDQLGDLAQMRVLGMWEDTDSTGKHTLYVVARTLNEPGSYYWRRCEAFGAANMCWSGWNSIDLDVSSEQVLLFVLNNNLNIAWPIIRKTQDSKTRDDRWEIQLAWTQHTARGWGQKKISKKTLVTNCPQNISEARGIIFRLDAFKDTARIWVYGVQEIALPEPVKPSNKDGALLEAVDPQTCSVKVRVYRHEGVRDRYTYTEGATVNLEYYYYEPLSQIFMLLEDISDRISTKSDGTAFAFHGYYETHGENKYPLISKIVAHISYGEKEVSKDFVAADDETRPFPSREDRFFKKYVERLEWDVVIEVDSIDNITVDQHSDRPLVVKWTGGFIISPSSEVSVITEPPTSQTALSIFDNAIPYANGFQQEASPSTDSLRLALENEAVTMFTQTPGRYLAIPASVSSGERLITWHYEDLYTSAYLQLLTDKTLFLGWRLFIDQLTCIEVLRQLAYTSIDALYTPAAQNLEGPFDLTATHGTLGEKLRHGDSLLDNQILFDLRAPAALYNWELFLHTPLLIAEFFTRQQRFEDARRWLHYVFDPTAGTSTLSSPQKKIDAFVIWPNGKAYIFKGNQYYSYDVASNTADEGYPRLIQDDWPGVWSRDLDAVIVWPGNIAYFFKGDSYIRYDIRTKAVVEGYPKKIKGAWNGLWEQGIDTAVVWSSTTAYFFKDDQYISYDITTDTVAAGYPITIEAGWGGVWKQQIDAAVRWSDATAYFFKGDEYIRYDISADRAANGYPLKIKVGWPGVWADEIRQYWQFSPFRQSLHGESILKLLTQRRQVGDQITAWRDEPFNPHKIARMRPLTYQWRTVFAYLDNLIAWGDQLFRRDTRESINEATMLYLLAARLLGPRPLKMKAQMHKHTATYRSYYGQWDEFSNLWDRLLPAIASSNGGLKYDGGDIGTGKDVVVGKKDIVPGGTQPNAEQTETLSSIGMLYFCIPHNEKLLEYWDRVEERLFKIRHSQNIDGITRELALWEPPIDPDLLVRAAAAGLDIAAALSELYAPLLPYRFQVLVQKADALCSELKALGSSLLAALEKKDAEGLALLRSTQEKELLDLITYIKDQQIEEARRNLDTLTQNESVVFERFGQYQKLLGKPVAAKPKNGLPNLEVSSSLQVAASAPGEAAGLALIEQEVKQLDSLKLANQYMGFASILNTVASVLHMAPNVSFTNSYGSFSLGISMGGSNMGLASTAGAAFLNMLSSNASYDANRSSLFAQYQRRRDEWVHQSKLAHEELNHLQKQKLTAEIRLKILQREQENHLKQIKHAQALNDFMKSKYTNQELYSWMIGEISSVYFQTYQLVHTMAKRAERAFQHELGLENTAFIQSNDWDSLKKGLLAGEHLALALKRMESAYLEQNQREFEITKHISLLQLDPQALIILKETGKCEIALPEALFDLDFPGHYLRRIKTISLSIPCVTGPYTNVNCTLTLLRHSYRRTTQPGTQYGRNAKPDGEADDDTRFADSRGITQSIATSSGQNDSGLFELNFHDERYLPFEGAGVISWWRLELSGKWPQEDGSIVEWAQFDFGTISDVILHMRYTARDGGDTLKSQAIRNIQEHLNQLSGVSLVRLFSMRHEFPTEWQRFLYPPVQESQQLRIALTPERFPLLFWSKQIQITELKLALVFSDRTYQDRNKLASYAQAYTDSESLALIVTPPTPTTTALPVGTKDGAGNPMFVVDPELGNLPAITVRLSKTVVVTHPGPHDRQPPANNWIFTLTDDAISVLADALKIVERGISRLNPEAIEDLLIVCHYTVS